MNLIIGELCLSDKEVGNVNMPNSYVPEDPTYADGMAKSFATIAKTMTKLTNDGKVLKQVLFTGFSSSIPHNAKIAITYKFCSGPFESPYTRVKPFIYWMGVDKTVAGLDIAIQSMKLGEAARFLMTSEYAYGKDGYLNLVPPYSSVLYEVNILPGIGLHSLNSFITFNNCLIKTAIGNRLVMQNRYKLAIRQYHGVIFSIENSVLGDADERRQYSYILMYVYANLVGIHTKFRQSKLACFNANKASKLCKEYSLELPLKVYLHKARSLIELGDYSKAEKLLEKVGRLAPGSKMVKQEFVNLHKKQRESRGEPEPPPTHEKGNPKRVRKEIELNSINTPIDELIAIKTEPLPTHEESNTKRVRNEIEFNSINPPIEELDAIKTEPLPTHEESNLKRVRKEVKFNLTKASEAPIEELIVIKTEVADY